MLSKRHFEWAARYINEEREANRRDHRDDYSDEMERFAVALFRRFGPNFNESCFREACRDKADPRVCNECGRPAPKGYTVTCGRSECQEAHHKRKGFDQPKQRHVNDPSGWRR